MRLKELESRLCELGDFSFPSPKVALEQYPTSPHLAAQLLFTASNVYDDVEAKNVLDLGCGTGILSISAALLDAGNVLGVDVDPEALAVASAHAEDIGEVSFLLHDVTRLATSFSPVASNATSSSKMKRKGNEATGNEDVNDTRGKNTLPRAHEKEEDEGDDASTTVERLSTSTMKKLNIKSPTTTTTTTSSSPSSSSSVSLPPPVRTFDTVIMNPPFGTKARPGMDVVFLEVARRMVRAPGTEGGGVIYSLHKSTTREFLLKKARDEWGLRASEVVAEMRFELPKTYAFHKKESVDVAVDLIRFACCWRERPVTREQYSINGVLHSLFPIPISNFTLETLHAIVHRETKMASLPHKTSMTTPPQILLRIRPRAVGDRSRLLEAGAPDAEEDALVHDGRSNAVRVRDLEGARHTFAFDAVLPQAATQTDVLETIRPMVGSIFDGFNASILCYGQTGSGKTYTMFGERDSPGLVPRLVEAIFGEIERRQSNIQFTVKVTFVEIYLERVRDLFDETKTNLEIRQHGSGGDGIFIKDATELFFVDPTELLEEVARGRGKRATAYTKSNFESSRSHCVLTIHLVQQDLESGATVSSKINLVDLAGSELVKRSGVVGERLEETKSINSSLSALGNVINALTDEKRTHVPYRDSSLTRLLQESLGGNAMTVMIINVSPAREDAVETLSSLRFAARAKRIKNKPVVNRTRTVKELEALLEEANKRIAALTANTSPPFRRKEEDEEEDSTKKREIEALREKLAEKDRENRALEDVVVQLRRDNVAWEDRFTQTSNQLTSAREELETRENELAETRKRCEELTDKIEALTVSSSSSPALPLVATGRELASVPHATPNDDGASSSSTSSSTTTTTTEGTPPNYPISPPRATTTADQTHVGNKDRQRLDQLIAVHRQFLKKYATLESLYLRLKEDFRHYDLAVRAKHELHALEVDGLRAEIASLRATTASGGGSGASSLRYRRGGGGREGGEVEEEDDVRRRLRMQHRVVRAMRGGGIT